MIYLLLLQLVFIEKTTIFNYTYITQLYQNYIIAIILKQINLKLTLCYDNIGAKVYYCSERVVSVVHS